MFQLGFLDGKPGLIYHVLQGFWFRFLVGAKIDELERGMAGLRPEERLPYLGRATGLRLASDGAEGAAAQAGRSPVAIAWR